MSPPVELAEVPELFEAWLAGRPLADRSRREYARNVRAYCDWLAVTPDRDGWQGDPLSDALARDHAARDFRRYLRVEKRAAASTVNLAAQTDRALLGRTVKVTVTTYLGGGSVSRRCSNNVATSCSDLNSLFSRGYDFDGHAGNNSGYTHTINGYVSAAGGGCA